MMKRLSELKSQMQAHVPKTIDRSYADSVLSVPQSNASESEWEDVDTDDEVDDDDNTTTDDVKILPESSTKSDLKASRITDRGDKKSVDEGKHEKLILPSITKKTIEVKVKTGRDGESVCDDYTETKDETVGDVGNDSQSDEVGESLSSSSPPRIPGPSKPIHNFTHRSSEFSDMSIHGKQAYNDDDVIACVRDVNKNKSTRSGKVGETNKGTDQDNATAEEQEKVSKPKVPLKIRVLRKKLRKDSPSRKVKSIASVKRQKKSKFLPQIKTAGHSSSLHQLKTTRRLPTHEPQRINFLPDIYDKYARKSVSTSSAKTTSSKNSKKK